MGLSNQAARFLEAANALRKMKSESFTPLYFLACQSIELSMKAYLRAKGYSDKKLRTIGHNLNECVAASQENEIRTLIRFTVQEKAIIRAINPYYQGKDLQYSKSGYKSFPHIDLLLDFATRLQNSTRDFCIKHRAIHTGKPTEVS